MQEPRAGLTEEQQEQMKGEILVDLENLENDVLRVTGKIYIHAEPGTVWRALTDYDHLSETMPKLSSSRLVGQGGSGKIVDQTGRTGIFIFEKSVHFRLQVREQEPRRIDFRQESGDFRVYNGSWNLDHYPAGQGTFLTYQAEVKPDFFAPPFLVSFVQRQDLPAILKAIKSTCESAGHVN
jgi:carbon monoxide dehydrogenase subunit G